MPLSPVGLRTASWLIGLPHIVSAVAFVFAVPEHVADPSWPPHARNHVLQALFWVVGFHAASLIVLFGPFRRGEGWAWGFLALAGAFLFGGYFAAILITRGGAPGPGDDVFFGVLSLVYIGGLYTGRDRREGA